VFGAAASLKQGHEVSLGGGVDVLV
jgi:hypothetical protein